MTRSLLALVFGLVPTAAVLADGLIPPPPGKKFVAVDYVITTDKTFPDYDFYLVKGRTPTKVEFGPDAPVKIGAKRARGFAGAVRFVAVEKGAEAKYPDVQGFANAIEAKSVPGLAAANNAFKAQATIDAKDTRTSLVETYAVEKIDAKDGIVLKAAKGAAPPKDGDKTAPELSDGPIDFGDETADDGPALYVPRGGAVVAGLAAALGLAFAGLWLARRSRPH
ncbi:MAG TPA: hypothetical protein VH092_11195 [Urbifossiella sp.]|jgi:hypothetical protein|nr:hypothetical protein [Urbifossiella sp.]